MLKRIISSEFFQVLVACMILVGVGLYLAQYSDPNFSSYTTKIEQENQALAVNKAREARLIGWCNGKLLTAMEEDEFPHGCAWIEGINLYSEDME